MIDKYLVFNNGSKLVNEMEEFFDKHNILYVSVSKPKESSARVFPPNNEPSYREKDFKILKEKILEERGINN